MFFRSVFGSAADSNSKNLEGETLRHLAREIIRSKDGCLSPRSILPRCFTSVSTFSATCQIFSFLDFRTERTRLPNCEAARRIYEYNGDFSIARMTSEGRTAIALHILTMVSSLALTRPRSIRLTVVRSHSAFSLTVSCETRFFFLNLRKASPNAFSGPERG